MHLLDQYGSDGVRYWSLSARLGTDTVFDEKILEVGRRLVTKVFNASKFVLSQSADEEPIVNRLDLSFLARLRETTEKATASLDALDYAGASRHDRAVLLGVFAASRGPKVFRRAQSPRPPRDSQPDTRRVEER